MIKICLFDLDDTLIRSGDLKTEREACKNTSSSTVLNNVRAYLIDKERLIYGPEVLESIRSKFPDLILGVFTRSPRSYAELILGWAYPGFEWDILIAYEDVGRTKPFGDGIDTAMKRFKITDLDEVMLVGDNDIDVRSAYHCGCLVTLDKGAWPYKMDTAHWSALAHIPDAIIDDPSQLLKVIADRNRFLPELERLLDMGKPSVSGGRFDKINHFVNRGAGGDNTAFPIYACGRSFSNHKSVEWRHKWCKLTQSIAENKDSEVFPDEWVQAVRTFIQKNFLGFLTDEEVVATVVPHRPGRQPRLEKFLTQLAESVSKSPLNGINLMVEPELLKFKKGVKSQHNDLLKADERFLNVRDHLIVNKPEVVSSGISYLVIDDVCTTGASLIYANKYLKEAGATKVECLAIAKNIGDVLR
jgi:phosphoglycolate phosphatase-like HAD superfamily hydrolase